MSILIKGMEMPKHAAVNGEKDTIYQSFALHSVWKATDLTEKRRELPHKED